LLEAVVLNKWYVVHALMPFRCNRLSKRNRAPVVQRFGYLGLTVSVVTHEQPAITFVLMFCAERPHTGGCLAQSLTSHQPDQMISIIRMTVIPDMK
jgi:hypothetical protein